MSRLAVWVYSVFCIDHYYVLQCRWKDLCRGLHLSCYLGHMPRGSAWSTKLDYTPHQTDGHLTRSTVLWSGHKQLVISCSRWSVKFRSSKSHWSNMVSWASHQVTVAIIWPTANFSVLYVWVEFSPLRFFRYVTFKSIWNWNEFSLRPWQDESSLINLQTILELFPPA